MSNVNKIILLGNLGHTPELQTTEKGHSLVKLSVATSKSFKTAEGEEKKETSWHRATVWGKQAENCAKYLTKGSRVYLEGELHTKSYDDKQGIRRRSAEINVDSVVFLGRAERSESPRPVEEMAL